jgi:hypothetical protein
MEERRLVHNYTGLERAGPQKSLYWQALLVPGESVHQKGRTGSFLYRSYQVSHPSTGFHLVQEATATGTLETSLTLFWSRHNSLQFPGGLLGLRLKLLAAFPDKAVPPRL